MSFNSTILGLSPLDFFRFSETSGSTAANLATSGRPGTYESSVTLNVTPGLVINESSTPCASMAGGTTATGVAVANPNITGSFTILAVINAPSAADGLFSCILGSKPLSGHGRFVFANNGGLFSQFDTTTLTSASSVIPKNNTCVVAIVNDTVANTQTVYLNGVADPITVVAASGLANAYYWGQDFDSETDYKFNGKIAAGALFASALTTAQIKNITAVALAAFANPNSSIYINAILASSPTRAYVLNEVAGQLAQDFSANAAHGTYVGLVTKNVTPGAVVADPTTPWVSFPGGDGVTPSSNGVSCPPLGIGANASFTVEAVIELAAFSDQYLTIFGATGNSGNLVNHLYVYGNNDSTQGHILAQFGSAFITTQKLALNTRYHIVFVNDETNAVQNIYINGVLSATQAVPGTVAALNTLFWIGQQDTGNRYKFNGDIGYLNVYPSAMTAATVLRNANIVLAGPLVVSPTSLTFSSPIADVQQVAVSRANYIGNFYSSASGSASAAPPSLTNGSLNTYFLVSPNASGSGSVTITDDASGSVVVTVMVGALGGLIISSISGSFSPSGQFTVSETNYTGPFATTVSDPTIAYVQPPPGQNGPGPLVYQVYGTQVGVTTITVSDNHGGTESFQVSIDALSTAPSYVGRLQALFPRRWAGSSAWNNGVDGNPVGLLYALMNSIGIQLQNMILNLWPYVRLQTRLATISDGYADLAWQDFYRFRDGRRIGESDSVTMGRLRQQLTSPTGTQSAVLSEILSFIATYPEYVNSIDVFDRQTGPVRSAYYGILDSQFAVILYSPETGNNAGWYMGQSFMGQDTFLTDPYAFQLSQNEPLPGLAAIVNANKDIGFRPIYITSRGEPPGFSDS